MITITLSLSGPTVAAGIKPANAPSTTNKSNSKSIQFKKLSKKQILTHLLTAELALQRNMYDEALTNYLLVAKETQDPTVAQLATELALETQDSLRAKEASEVWANSDPENVQAQLVALTLYISDNEAKAQAFLENALVSNPQELDQNLLAVFDQLQPKGKKHLTEAVAYLAERHPQNPYAQLASAQIHAIQLDVNAANKRLAKTLALQPNLTNAIQLQAKLIRHEKQSDQPALEYLDAQVNKHPNNSELRMFYAMALLDNDQSNSAMQHLQMLTRDKQFAGEAYLIIGEDEINQGKYVAAEKNIKQALEYASSVDKARYYLAQLAEYHKNNAEAISWYEQVASSSEFHTSAFLRAAYLYSLKGDYENALNTLQSTEPNTFEEQKQVLLTEIDIMIESNDLDKALENCNRVLGVLPNDVDFLYARSLILSMLQKYAAAERDLKLVLSVEPDNANSLNALAFILTNQPDRVKEALPYIQKAIGLQPNNPAYMDTLGWYYYKSGNTQDAIAMLEKAYKISGNAEIAAHLGEVLWTSGQQQAAKDVWQKALLSTENKDIIQKTLTRLNIPLADIKPTAR